MFMSQPVRCALLGSSNLDPLPGLVAAGLEGFGISAQWWIAPYGQYAQAILDPSSDLYEFDPHVVWVAVDAEDLFAGIPAPWASGDNSSMEIDERIRSFINVLRVAAEHLARSLIVVHSLESAGPRPHALLAYKSGRNLETLVARTNLALAELAQNCGNVFILDLADTLADLDRHRAFDRRYYYAGRIRFAPLALQTLAGRYVRILLARTGCRKKCLVVDLDNTLWGGILGEDGPEHLALGQDGLGLAFRDFQAVLLQLHATGTLLAICSKNDFELATTTLREHPGMLLRPEHFAAMRINWQDKVTNLHEIAKELNLGLDSVVFVDDSPFEREQVRLLVPGVTVVDLPDDPAEFASTVAALPYFDLLAITEEDRRRNQMYVEERQRQERRVRASSLEEYLHSLNTVVTIRRASRAGIARLAQLSQRTNQFNLTTHRYSEDELILRCSDAAYRVYQAEVEDRIGESGVVGLAVVVMGDPPGWARLEAFMLSCRVLGRGVESAFLAGLVEDVGEVAVRLRAEYIPTKRNTVAASFLPAHGFVAQDGAWVGNCDSSECPSWINLVKHTHEPQISHRSG